MRKLPSKTIRSTQLRSAQLASVCGGFIKKDTTGDEIDNKPLYLQQIQQTL